MASSTGKEDVVEILLKNGASVHERTNFGDTALHLAAQYGSYKCAEFLLIYGADKNVRNNRGNIPTANSMRKDVEELLKNFQDIPDIKEPDEDYS